MIYRIERYILWLAPALVIQMLGRYLSSGPGLAHMKEPAMWFLLQPAGVISIAAFLTLLPTLVTAVWVSIDSDSSAVVKAAWFVCGLFMSYFVLIPYVGSLLLRAQSRLEDGN
ncbi:MAG: hypothetical protein AAFN50_14375 [Pseudomonadota bacterium]